jgi:Bacterial regulatory proteins, luxR family
VDQQEVADQLNLQTKTVEWTLTNVYRKLHLRSRTELALTLVGVGLAEAGDSPHGARGTPVDQELTIPDPLPAGTTDLQICLISRRYSMELAGLEPATSWVR